MGTVRAIHADYFNAEDKEYLFDRLSEVFSPPELLPCTAKRVFMGQPWWFIYPDQEYMFCGDSPEDDDDVLDWGAAWDRASYIHESKKTLGDTEYSMFEGAPEPEF